MHTSLWRIPQRLSSSHHSFWSELPLVSEQQDLYSVGHPPCLPGPCYLEAGNPILSGHPHLRIVVYGSQERTLCLTSGRWGPHSQHPWLGINEPPLSDFFFICLFVFWWSSQSLRSYPLSFHDRHNIRYVSMDWNGAVQEWMIPLLSFFFCMHWTSKCTKKSSWQNTNYSPGVSFQARKRLGDKRPHARVWGWVPRTEVRQPRPRSKPPKDYLRVPHTFHNKFLLTFGALPKVVLLNPPSWKGPILLSTLFSQWGKGERAAHKTTLLKCGIRCAPA